MSLFNPITMPFRLANRSRQIFFVLSRHGMVGTLTQLGLEVGKRGVATAFSRPNRAVPFDQVFARNLAHTLAELGPTFIKLGQMLATRPDLVGEVVAEELKVLFDRVPALSFSKIKKILRREWGKNVAEQELREIDSTPLASASLSQTHRAKLKDGTPVILKVQKDGVAEMVRLDLVWLGSLAHSLDTIYPRWGIGQVFDDFKQATLREISYLEEAKNIDRFKKNYRGLFSDSGVVIPKYYKKLLTDRVIVLEPIHGHKLSGIQKGSRTAKKAATKSLSALLEQIFDHGFFHADPHGGNLFFLEDSGQIGFIDLGLVGTLSPEDKKRFLGVLFALLKRDREKLAKALYELGAATKRTDYQRFETQIQAMLDEVKAKGIDAIRMDKLVNQLLAIARSNEVSIPNRYILMIRSCLIIEGVAKGLDPSLSIFDIALPIVSKSLLKTYSPLNWLKARKR